MLDPLIHLLNDRTPLSSPWGRIVVIAALFGVAWPISRLSASVAVWLVNRHDRRHRQGDPEETGEAAGIKRRETLVGVIRASITYAAFAAAVAFSIAQLIGGVERLTAIAGVSFALLVAAFAAQRVLIDMIAGFAMFMVTLAIDERAARSFARATAVTQRRVPRARHDARSAP
jgi:small-conductance mechanosensitive channel